MKDTRLIMGMPIEIELVGEGATEHVLEDAFSYLVSVDERFSPYQDDSEVSRYARGELTDSELSEDLKEVLARAEEAKSATNGFFDIRRPDGRIDPSGIVKGWAIKNAAARVRAAGCDSFFVNAGGDIASSGTNAKGEPWSVGIENPFNRAEIVKVVYPHGKGIATSGSYIRGAHIYDPYEPTRALDDVVSVSVIGPDVERADVFATAAFAMGRAGIAFIESQPGFEAYQIDAGKTATMTSGFPHYTSP
jgi:FAD:protein FMN transferase